MPIENSVEKVGSTVVRFKTSKFGVAVFRQRYTDRGENKYSNSFYFSKTVNKRLVRFPVGIEEKKAEKLAEEIAAFLSLPMNTVDMAVARYNPRHNERFNQVATFQDVVDAYEGALGVIGRKGKSVGASTFKGYKSSLLTMLRRVEAWEKGVEFESFSGRNNIDYSPWFGKPLTILTRKFAMDFKLSCLPPAPDGETEPDEDEALTAKISADTVLRCARALFSKSAMRYYREEIKLNLPDLSAFMQEPDFGAKKYFELLSPEVIVGIMRASLELRIADIDAYRAFVLCMFCGLRRAESLSFDPEWMREDDRPVLLVRVKGRFKPKHGHGRKVAIEPWVAALLTELGPIQDDGAVDRLNTWMRGLIPAECGVSKPLHEARKCWVSAKSKVEGILAASQQAGHHDTRTTSVHYADNMLPDKLLPLWKKPTGAAILDFKKSA